MNKIITNRQLIFGIVMLSLSPIFRHLPKAVCATAKSAGYLSVIIGGLVAFIAAFCVFYIIKKFPAQNLYEILCTLTGKIIAKTLMLVTLGWAILNVICKLHFHSLTCQGTLMPYSTNSFIFAIMLILSAYCLIMGIKTAMRISELLLSFLLIVLFILLLICMQNFDAMNLLPITFSDTAEIVRASPYSFSIFGFIILSLFYTDKLDRPQISFKPYAYFILTVTIISLAVTVVTVGVQGAELSSSFAFPFYSVVKRTSFLNIFERMEPFIILPNMISDFIFITFFMSVILLSLKWMFSLPSVKYIFIPVFILIYVAALFFAKTQFEIEAFYYGTMTWINSIFEYAFPILMLIVYLFRRKKISNN